MQESKQETRNMTQVLEKRAITLCKNMEALQAKAKKTNAFNLRPIIEQLADMQQELNRVFARLLCS